MAAIKDKKGPSNDNPLLQICDGSDRVEIIDAPLEQDSPKDLIEISPTQELGQKIDMINEIESLTILAKQQLSAKRQQIELEVETKKLEAANKTIDNIQKIIEAVSKTEVLERVTKSINTPLDMKLMAEAAERLTNTLRGLMNPNVLDDMGTKKKLKINLMFKSSGPVQGAVQVATSDD